MTKINKKIIFFLPLIGYLLLSLSFPPFYLWQLLFIGYIPILLYFSLKKEILPIYLSSVFFYLFTFLWMFRSCKYFPINYLSIPLLCLILGIYQIIPFFIAKKIKVSNKWKIIIASFLIVAIEYIKSSGELACPFGNPIINIVHSPIKLIFNYLGIWGTYLIILFINIFILFTFVTKNKVKRILNLVFIFFLIVILLIGSMRKSERENTFYSKLQLILVQPEISLYEKWNIKNNYKIAQKVINQLKNVKIKKDIPTLVVLPETTCYNTDFFNPVSIPDIFIKWAKEKKVYLLIGSFVILYKENRLKPYIYNAAIFYDYKKDSCDYYYKVKPVPFVEAPPWSDKFPILKKIFNFFVASMDKGTKLSIFKIGDIKIAPLICFESSLYFLVDDFKKKGATLFVVITNDNWFDNSSGLEQHFDFCMMQSIRTNIPFIQCGNSGITAIVDDKGKVLAELKKYKKGILNKIIDIPLN